MLIAHCLLSERLAIHIHVLYRARYFIWHSPTGKHNFVANKPINTLAKWSSLDVLCACHHSAAYYRSFYMLGLALLIQFLVLVNFVSFQISMWCVGEYPLTWLSYSQFLSEQCVTDTLYTFAFVIHVKKQIISTHII